MMIQSDPTAPSTEGSVETLGSQEELSLEQIAEIEVFQTAGDSTLTGNGTTAQMEGAVVEEIAETAVDEIAAIPARPPVARPIPPVPWPITRRKVSGRYHSTGVPWRVELRVDIDGTHPTMRVSADYFQVLGRTVSYFGSMRVDAPTISVSPAQVTITGLGTYTWAAGAPRVKITIPRVPAFRPPAPATLQHLTLGGGIGATYVCGFDRALFRTVLLDQDRQDTVPAPFVSYNTGSLPSGGPARTLTVNAAYAEAGVEMLTGGAPDVVATLSGSGLWSNAELQTAMQAHFELWQNLPHWGAWLFHAQEHDLGPGLYGIMFAQYGAQRQGCAVFYAGIGGATPDKQRLQLYTCTHELGHCFNLLHSWQKSLAKPPGVDDPNALSWMNYPWRYPPGGAAAFWNAFPFQFVDSELVHIRHGFRNNVIMGGNPFTVGSALEDPEGWQPPVEDDSGLKLELEAPSIFLYGEPVSVRIHLTATDSRAKEVDPRLKPSFGTVEVAIRKPNDRAVIYRPLIQQCLVGDTSLLDRERPSIADAAFLGYGEDGFIFDQPGFYRVQARYSAPDGSKVLSNVASIRVRTPLTAEDEAVADLFFGDQQGTLFTLVGSDSPYLTQGNDALRRVREEHPDHPLTLYVQIVQGVNAAREFKHVATDGSVTVRPPQPDEARHLLETVVDIAGLQAAVGAEEVTPETAHAAANRLVSMSADRKLPAAMATYIEARKVEIATEIMGL